MRRPILFVLVVPPGDTGVPSQPDEGVFLSARRGLSNGWVLVTRASAAIDRVFGLGPG